MSARRRKLLHCDIHNFSAWSYGRATLQWVRAGMWLRGRRSLKGHAEREKRPAVREPRRRFPCAVFAQRIVWLGQCSQGVHRYGEVMQVVALPGRRSETVLWLRELLHAVGLPDSGVVRYRHWHSDVEASVSFEAGLLADQTPQLVVAKSLGTVIAASAFAHHGFRPTAAVLVGTPFQAVAAEDLRLLQNFALGVETLFIQQIQDPGGPAAALHDALRLTRGQVAAIPGSDHLYSDVSALVSVLGPWIARHPDTREFMEGRASRGSK